MVEKKLIISSLLFACLLALLLIWQTNGMTNSLSSGNIFSAERDPLLDQPQAKIRKHDFKDADGNPVE